MHVEEFDEDQIPWIRTVKKGIPDHGDRSTLQGQEKNTFGDYWIQTIGDVEIYVQIYAKRVNWMCEILMLTRFVQRD